MLGVLFRDLHAFSYSCDVILSLGNIVRIATLLFFVNALSFSTYTSRGTLCILAELYRTKVQPFHV